MSSLFLIVLMSCSRPTESVKLPAASCHHQAAFFEDSAKMVEAYRKARASSSVVSLEAFEIAPDDDGGTLVRELTEVPQPQLQRGAQILRVVHEPKSITTEKAK